MEEPEGLSQDPFPTEFLTDAKETLRQFVERD